MSKPKFITELLKVDHVVGENARQETLVKEITLPFLVRKITDVDARVNVESRVIDDKVVVEGTLSKTLTFVDEKTGQLREFEVPGERFTTFVDVPGAEPGMDVQERVRVEFVGHQLIGQKEHHDRPRDDYQTDSLKDDIKDKIKDGMKDHEKDHHHDGHHKDHHKPHKKVETIFRQTAVLEIFVKVTKSIQQKVVVDVLNIDPRRVKKKLIKVEAVVGEDAQQTQVESRLTFEHPVRNVRTVEARVQVDSDRVIENKVVVEGTLHKVLFVTDENGELTQRRVEEMFTATIPIPGARPGMNVQVHPRVEDVSHQITDGGLVVRQLAILDIFVKVTETFQFELVVDIKDFPVQKELLKLAQVVGEGKRQISVVREVDFSTPVQNIITPPRREVRNLTSRVIDNKVIVEGTLHKNIFFVEEKTGRVLDIGVDEPFRTFIDIPGARPGMNVQVYPRVELVTFDFTPGNTTARQTAILEISVKVTETIQQEVVVVEKRVVDDDISVKVYIVQPGDTLFKIAQRFNTTVDAILAINPEIKDPNLIFPGQKILIPIERKFEIYVVQPGDTLFRIAQRFGVTVAEILAINPEIKDPDDIRPGQKIRIPVKPVPPKPKPRVYVVQPGDTMFKIAQRFGISLKELIRANPQIKDPNLIFPGQRINIPVTPRPPKPKPIPSPDVYIVQPGDTMFKIAQRFGISLSELIAANPQIKDPNLIFPGQRINIPRKKHW